MGLLFWLEDKAGFTGPPNPVVELWVIWVRIPFAVLAACVFGCICYKLYPFVKDENGSTKIVDPRTKLLFAIWTIGVPIYLFVETAFGTKLPVDETGKAMLEHFKAAQDAARAVWAGCAAAIAVLILKP